MAQRTLIVGLGVTGLSCVRHLAGTDQLSVADTREQPPGLAAAMAEHPEVDYRVGPDKEVELNGLDRVVMSPGVSPHSPLAQRIAARELPVLSDVDLFCRNVDEPIYAVTGTNGKSTVTTLVGHILTKLNHCPGVGGNLGKAALDLIRPDHDCYVLELSSFQLERMQAYPYEAATITNITADHLDRYGDMASYVQAKQRIYRRALRIIANRDDALSLPGAAAKGKLTTFGKEAPSEGHWGVRVLGGSRWLSWGNESVLETGELPVFGAHNETNALAAMALIYQQRKNRTGLKAIAEAIGSYRGLAHRCEVVAVIDRVTYVNDSKATNPGATLAALQSLPGHPKSTVLIAGGEGKDANFDLLGDAIAKCARGLITVGRDGAAIAKATNGRVPVAPASCMAEAVHQAAKVARPGDTVLLSPACASLDQFKSFEERGEVFRALVEELQP